MTGVPPGGERDVADVDALATDRYLDSILDAHGRGADAGPVDPGRRPPPRVRHAVDRLAHDLPRLHPSFRFEEALAARLAEAAARMRLPLAAGGEGVIIPVDLHHAAAPAAGPGGLDDGQDAEPRQAFGRELLIGGALTSAAFTLAGAAYVAWRIRHPHPGPMARAVRAVARARLA